MPHVIRIKQRKPLHERLMRYIGQGLAVCLALAGSSILIGLLVYVAARIWLAV